MVRVTRKPKIKFMKKVKIIVFVLFIGFISCTTGYDSLEEFSTNDDAKIEYRISIKLVKLHWDEWGRAKKDCDGWGLCNFQSCWFWQDCWTESFVVPPNGGSGTVEFDDETRNYSLIIELDPTNSIQNDAINSEKVFYVDEDIIEIEPSEGWSKMTIKAGIYSFDSEIGNSGGYSIDVIKD